MLARVDASTREGFHSRIKHVINILLFGTPQLDQSAKTLWLQNAVDVEFLRFIRATKQSNNNAINTVDVWRMIMNHARWRISPYGPDATEGVPLQLVAP